NHCLQSDSAFFTLLIDLLPLGEMLPSSSDAANTAFGAVRQDDDAVVPEDLWDGGAVVREVELEGIFQMLVECLEFNKEKGNTVHEAVWVVPPPAVFTRNPELRGEEEIVVGRMFPIDDLYSLNSFVVVRGSVANLNPVL